MSKQQAILKKKLEKAKKELQESDDAKNIALLRFYYKEDPEKWSDSKYAKRLSELDYVLKKTGVLDASK